MVKTHREGVDIGVAFAAQMKRARAASLATAQAGAPATPGQNEAAAATLGPIAMAASLRPAPSTARAGGHLAIRLVKPLLRPIASRIRRYLTAPFEQDWQFTRAALEDMKGSQAALRQEIRANQAVLVQDGHVAKDRARLDLQGALVETLRELRALQDAHEHTVRASRDALLAELGTFGDRLDVDRARERQATSEDVAALRRAMEEAMATSERAIRDSTDHQLQRWHREATTRLDTLATALRAVATTAHLDAEIQRIETAVADQSQRIRTEVSTHLATLTRELQAQFDRVEAYAMAAARRIAVPCGPDTTLVRSAVGYVLCDSLDHATLAALLEAGEMETGTRLAIQAILQPGDCFIDVGANIGLHTIAAGTALRGSGRILAVEPYEPTARRLQETVWMNGLAGLVEVHRCAAFSRPGRMPLFLGVTSGHHSLLAGPSTARGHDASVEVPASTLDALAGMTQSVALIKIDVEGVELDVLEGASGLVRNNAGMGMIVEFAPSHLARTDRSIEEWLGAFGRLGLIPRQIDEADGTLQIVDIDDLRHVRSTNLLFARPEAALWRRMRSRS